MFAIPSDIVLYPDLFAVFGREKFFMCEYRIRFKKFVLMNIPSDIIRHARHLFAFV